VGAGALIDARTRTKEITMRKLTLTLLAAIALLAVTAMPAAAKPRGTNGQIAFGRQDPLLGDTVLYSINPDGSHERQVLPFGLEVPRWSPDGSAIVTPGSEGGGTLFTDAALIIDPDTGAYREVPNRDPDTYFMPCDLPSPDFERLACEGFGQTDPSLNGIYTLRTSDGGDLKRLTSNTFDDIPGDYSPDGKRLVFSRGPGLFTVKANGSGLRQLTPPGTFASSPGNWSPQGNEIVFSGRVSRDVRSSIWVIHSDGSGLREIPVVGSGCGGPFADPATASCLNPVWSPDGKKIVFKRATGTGEGGDLHTINVDGTGLTQVTHDGDVEFGDWGTHPVAHE
jgi:Tol biopolymer transport system component